MKWLVTGDWQARFSNLRECELAHRQECRIIKEHHIGGHIDLGDLKDQYSPVDIDAIEFQFTRTKNIFKLVDPKNTVKLLGNHDRTGQHSDERNWLSLFKHLGGHIIDKPGVVETRTIVICGLPYTRDPKQFLKNADYLAGKAKKKHGAHILIFHQEVKDARFSRLRSYA